MEWVLLCFAAIYLVWGSTFLAIRYAVEELPPLLMAGARFLVAGAVLCVVAKARGAGRISGAAWASSALVGALMFGGNALLAWAETRLSGLAALMLATIPLWMAGPGSQGGRQAALGAAEGRVRWGCGDGGAGGAGAVRRAVGGSAGYRGVDVAALTWSVGS